MYTVFFSPYCDSFWHKLSQYGKKIVYTYVYHIVYYLRKFEALHEITDFVHEMLSVCAPYNNTSVSATNETRMPGHNDTRFKLYDTLLSKLCNTQSKLYDTLWNQTLWYMTLHDTPWHTKTYHDTPWHTMTQGRMWVMVEWIAEARDLQGWPFFSLDISDVTDAGNICVSWGPNWGAPPPPPRWYHTAVMFEGFQGCPPIWVSWCAESP